MKFGAVREMHQAKAAGTAIEANVEDDGRTYFGAHVVDSEAVKKVKAGVYKGFSIGGKVTARDELNKSIIKGIKLVEVSLVDRPANPEAVFTMYKAEAVEEPVAAIDQIAELLNKGEISPERILDLVNADKLEAMADKIETEASKAELIESLKKYAGEEISDSSSALQALMSVYYLLTKEAGQEEVDDGQVSALRACVEGLKAFIASEIQEDTSGDTKTFMYADKITSLAKGGAKYSADTKAKLDTALSHLDGAKEALTALDHNAKTTDDVEGDGGTKAETSEDLTKLAGELDLAKADLAKVSAERDLLVKRVADLEAQPSPGKALLKAVGKADDLGEKITEGEAVAKVAPVTDSKGDVNDVATIIKGIHSMGGVVRR